MERVRRCAILQDKKAAAAKMEPVLRACATGLRVAVCSVAFATSRLSCPLAGLQLLYGFFEGRDFARHGFNRLRELE